MLFGLAQACFIKKVIMKKIAYLTLLACSLQMVSCSKDFDNSTVDENYQISLVGSKSDNYLWILSRTPEADPDLLQMVLDEAESRGYDTSKLIWVDQSRNK